MNQVSGNAEIFLIHYSNALSTLVTLNSFFRHYPDWHIQVVDNSGGTCSFKDLVMPHLTGFADQITLHINPSDEHSPEGDASHGGGLDFAIARCTTPYFIMMESDTFINQRGGFERLLAYMLDGYDWAGFGQKPFGQAFTSFSPAFAIVRCDLINAYGLSFKRRNRSPDEFDADDPLIKHHLLAAEQARLNLPLTYPEGKPPNTYKLPREKIISRELAHVRYFDTAEEVHWFLTKKGYRSHLFKPDDSVIHIWGSRSNELYLEHFAEKLPDVSIEDYLPEGFTP